MDDETAQEVPGVIHLDQEHISTAAEIAESTSQKLGIPLSTKEVIPPQAAGLEITADTRSLGAELIDELGVVTGGSSEGEAGNELARAIKQKRAAEMKGE